MSNGTKVIVGAMAGLLAGTLIGLLIAPQSGKETREKIGEKTDDVLNYLNDFASRLRKKTKPGDTSVPTAE